MAEREDNPYEAPEVAPDAPRHGRWIRAVCPVCDSRVSREARLQAPSTPFDCQSCGARIRPVGFWRQPFGVVAAVIAGVFIFGVMIGFANYADRALADHSLSWITLISGAGLIVMLVVTSFARLVLPYFMQYETAADQPNEPAIKLDD